MAGCEAHPYAIACALHNTYGHRKLPRGGVADRSERSRNETEVRSADHSARSAGKNLRLNFQLSGWALVALSYFED